MMQQWANEDPLDRVRIPWTDRDHHLELSDFEFVDDPLDPGIGGFTVLIKQTSLTASVRIDQFYIGELDLRGFARFFEEMAREWRGWAGEKRGSLGHQLGLTGRYDGRVYVHCAAELDEDGHGFGWHLAGCTFRIELGHLEQIATDVRTFLRLPAHGGSGR